MAVSLDARNQIELFPKKKKNIRANHTPHCNT